MKVLNLAAAALLPAVQPAAVFRPLPPQAAPDRTLSRGSGASEAPRAERAVPAPADRTIPLQVFPVAQPEPAPAQEEPLPSVVPPKARPRPKALGRPMALSGATAEVLEERGSWDGFRLVGVKESEGFIIQYAPPAVPADPLVVDLDGDGLRTSARRAVFDIDGDGRRDSVSEIEKGDALLVYDPDGDGLPGEDGRELFGNSTAGGAPDGFAALESFVERAADDGLIGREALEGRSLGPAELEALEDAWGLRLRLGGLRGPLRRLTELGVVELRLGKAAGPALEDFDGRGNALTAGAGAELRFADGSRRGYGDLWLKRRGGELTPVLRASAKPAPMR